MTVPDRADRERGVAEPALAAAGPARPPRREARRRASTLLALAVYLSQSYIVAFGWAVIIVISVWPLYVRLRARCPATASSRRSSSRSCSPSRSACPSCSSSSRSAARGRPSSRGSGGAGAWPPVPAWVQNLPLLGGRIDAWWQSHLGRPHGPADLIGEINVDTVTSVSRTLGGEVLSRFCSRSSPSLRSSCFCATATRIAAGAAPSPRRGSARPASAWSR